jgi:hypothetical protein
MKVAEIISRANAAAVAELYNKEYNSGERDDGWGNIETFERFRRMVSQAVGIRSGDDQLTLQIKLVTDKICEEDEPYTDVSGIKQGVSHGFSIAGMDWGEVKEMEVVLDGIDDLSIDEKAMHIYYEMTWHGWPEEAREHIDEIHDMAEAISRKLGD